MQRLALKQQVKSMGRTTVMEVLPRRYVSIVATKISLIQAN